MVQDFVNCKIEGIDEKTKKQLFQALKFAVPGAQYTPQYKLGRWDGTVAFCSTAGHTFLNVLDRLLPIIEAAGYECVLDDRRPLHQFNIPFITDQLFADRVWPAGHGLAGHPIILRDYQVKAINLFLQELTSVQELATAMGKTTLTAALSHVVEPYGRSVIIVPSKSLVTQTEADYRNVGLAVGVYFGDRKELAQHVICTWQSLAALQKRTLDDNNRITLKSFLKDVVCVIVDEAHACKASLLRSMLCGMFKNVPIRWGVTGTIPKAEHEAMCLLSAIGPVVGRLPAVELQEKGVLANCQITVCQLRDPAYDFSSYQEELAFLLNDPVRLNYIATLIAGYSQSGNTLVLVERVEAGRVLHRLLPGSVFISGDTKTKQRAEEYQSIQTTDKKIIIATYGVASTGINIVRIFNLVLLESGKSFVKVLQSIGRGLRRSHDKDTVQIYDICSTQKFSKRHLAKRKHYYTDAQYPYRTTKLAYRADGEPWHGLANVESRV